MKDETRLIVLQMQGDQLMKKKQTDLAYTSYLAAANLADLLKKEEAARCIREKIKTLFPHMK
jgi:hypothetical protein